MSSSMCSAIQVTASGTIDPATDQQGEGGGAAAKKRSPSDFAVMEIRQAGASHHGIRHGVRVDLVGISNAPQ